MGNLCKEANTDWFFFIISPILIQFRLQTAIPHTASGHLTWSILETAHDSSLLTNPSTHRAFLRSLRGLKGKPHCCGTPSPPGYTLGTAESGVHPCGPAASPAVNNAMSECLSHLRGRKVFCQHTHTHTLTLNLSPNTLSRGSFPLSVDAIWTLSTVQPDPPPCLAALMNSIIYDGACNWLWLKDPHWNKWTLQLLLHK